MLMATNYNINLSIIALRTLWNGTSELALFQSDTIPDPTTVLSDLVEASYDGYAPIDLTGDWTVPVKDEEGFYSFETTAHQFDPPETGDTQNLYGYYITDGTEVVALERFPTPIPMGPGELGFRIRIKYTRKAEAVFCPGT